MIIKGKKVRGYLTELKLSEVSGVTRGGNQHARVALWKSAAGKPAAAVQKSELASVLISLFKDEEGAQTFEQVLTEREEERRRWEVDEALWPLFCALQESIKSIAADDGLVLADKMAQIGVSVGQFLTALRDQFPDVEVELTKLLSENPATAGLFSPGHEVTAMTKEEIQKLIDDAVKKSSEGATATIDTLKKQLDGTTAALAKALLPNDQREYLDALKSDESKAEFLKAEDKVAYMKAHPVVTSSGDESFTIGTTTILKSEVGPSVYAILKQQQNMIVASQARLEKMGETSLITTITAEVAKTYDKLPGTDADKAAAIAAVRKLDEPVAKTLEAMLKAGNAALAAVGKEAGGAGEKGGSKGDAEEELDKKAKDLQKQDPKLSFAKAYSKVLETPEGGELYGRMLQEQAEARRTAA